ncbi:MAG: ribulose-bisphosphate carboxylase large subunit family protein [Acidimicrobiales bacterium]
MPAPTPGIPRRDFTARYLVETYAPLEKAAEVIAGEQSCGTFITLPGETAELKERARARVIRIQPLEDVTQPSLPNAFAERRGVAGPYHRGIVDVSFPIHNVGPNLPNLYATVVGNLFELGELTGLRVLDVDLPDDYAAVFPGPAFGASGTRDVAKVHGRPMVGTIIKPSIGLSPEDTAALVDTLCKAGIDFIKDDELMGDPPYAPLEARVKAVMTVVNRHADRMGRKVMVAFNISDDLDAMRRHHDMVVREGGTCVMVSVNWTGPAAVTALRRHATVPIHGHRNGFGMFNREPSLGMDYKVYQKLWRLAGVDQLHVNGIRSKFWEPDDSVVASARACMAPFAGTRPIMPVFSSGQTAEQPPDTYAALRSTDLIYLAGGGIIGHPSGPRAGVQSLLEAWEAAVAAVPLDRYAETRPALRDALKAFAPKAKV